MRFKQTYSQSLDANPHTASRRAERAFTLAEALAALAFLSIVIPVAVQGLRVANQAGQVAFRKAEAGRLAERLLNEQIVTKQWQSSSLSGTIQEGPLSYRWQMRNQSWEKDTLKQVSVVVTYSVQGLDYDVRLSTVLDGAVQ